jgi:type II secretory pathway pseudopilin PulG
MKKENGITLVALVITIVVIFILSAISINYGVDSLTQSKNKLQVAELQMVEQAVAEQYIQSVEFGLDSTLYIDDEDNKPSIYVGTLIHFDELSNYSPDGIEYKLKDLKSDRMTEYSVPESEAEKKIAYSEFYYILTPDDLENLKIESNDSSKQYTYVVNYLTGEVFNYTKRKASGTNTALYYAGKSGVDGQSEVVNPESDTTSFTE